MNQQRHSVLHGIQENPVCGIKFEDMEGEGCTRRCGECKLPVYDIRGMDAAEVTKLIAAGEGYKFYRAKLFRRRDGTVTTEDCIGKGFKDFVAIIQPGPVHEYVLVLVWVGAVVAVMFGFARGSVSCTMSTSFSEVVSQLNELNRYAESQQTAGYGTYYQSQTGHYERGRWVTGR